jgi:hypothetical protein
MYGWIKASIILNGRKNESLYSKIWKISLPFVTTSIQYTFYPNSNIVFHTSKKISTILQKNKKDIKVTQP